MVSCNAKLGTPLEQQLFVCGHGSEVMQARSIVIALLIVGPWGERGVGMGG